MKTAIVNLTSGGLSGGYVKYLRRVIPLIRADVRVSRLDVFLPEGTAVPDCGAARTWPRRDALAGYRGLRRELQMLSPDVVFFPTARRIDCGGIPTVVMIRNMEPLTVPFGGNTWQESLRNVARARAARLACRRASRVIAVSRHVQRFAVERWRLPEERVGLVYHGVDLPAGLSAGGPPRAGWPARFLFTAGSIRPARGLEDVIRAMPALRLLDPSLFLVIAGKADAASRPYEARMLHLAERLGISDAILWAGQLDEGAMAWAYDRCAVFVVTSRAEACPNVALEAMSHGALIVSTSQEPMPEFFADTAAYYRPEDAADLAARVADILAEHSSVATPRRDRARARAGRYTWSRTAEETVAQLGLAIG